MRWALLLTACLASVGCTAPYQTLESTPDHVTYRFDPTVVSPDRVASAATIHCEDSANGSLRAIAVAETVDGADRVVRFDCGGLPSLDLDKALDKAATTIEKDVAQ